MSFRPLPNSTPRVNGLETRAFCIEALDIEIGRAANEVFCDAPLVQPCGEYRSTFDKAKHAQKMAHNCPRLSHIALELPCHWLTLIGFRIRIERGLVFGGLVAVRIRAAEELGQSPRKTSQWDMNILFQVYCTTRLRNEWKYEGLHFRFDEHG